MFVFVLWSGDSNARIARVHGTRTLRTCVKETRPFQIIYIIFIFRFFFSSYVADLFCVNVNRILIWLLYFLVAFFFSFLFTF